MTAKYRNKRRLYPSAHEGATSARLHVDSPQCKSPSYALAYQDSEFILRDELRPVRLQLEALKPEIVQDEQNIASTVVVFGSARLPDPETARRQLADLESVAGRHGNDPAFAGRLRKARQAVEKSRYYAEARKLGRLISSHTGKHQLVVVTGGGPGIMEAANRGAHDVGALSIGMNIVLPFEQAPNPYITPSLCFQFHYFAIRKMHFLMRARSLVVFPGGFGTLDELFETLTLVQTGKVKPFPILLFSKAFWTRIINFDALVEEGTVSARDLDIFQFVETAEEAWEIISKANGVDHAS